MSWFADKPPGLLFNAAISSYCDGEIFIVGFIETASAMLSHFTAERP